MDRIFSLLATKLTGKEVKKMKKLFVFLTIAALILTTSGTASALTYQKLSDVTKSAEAVVSGTEQVVIPLAITLKNVGTNATAGDQTKVTWTVDTGAGAPDWQCANQYLEVGGFATYQRWGIQIFTDNKNASANPQYTGTGNPAGLVNVSTGKSTIPMCYRIGVYSTIQDGRFLTGSNDLKMEEKYIATGVAAGDTVILRVTGDYINDADFFAPWYWMLDKEDLDPKTAGLQQQYGDYPTFVDTNSFKITPYFGDSFSIPKRDAKYCVYLGGKFTIASVGTTYKTSMLTVQMYRLY